MLNSTKLLPEQQLELNKELYQLSFGKDPNENNKEVAQKLSDSSFEKAKILLNKGANPNFTPEPYSRISLVESAIHAFDLRYLQLLIFFKADVEIGSVKNVKQLDEIAQLKDKSEIKKWHYKNINLPLQLAIQYLRVNYFNTEMHEICNILNRATSLSEVKEQVYHQVQQVYLQLMLKIKTELQIAKKKGKRLMILVGETHDALNTAMLESILILICTYYFGFNTVLHESDNEFLTQLKDRKKLPDISDQKWYCFWDVFQLVDSLHGNIIPIDLGRDGAQKSTDGRYVKDTSSNFNNTSTEGMRHRNHVMSEVANEVAKEHIIAQVGLSHIDGLLKNTSLKDNFHVFAVDASGTNKDTREAMLFFLKIGIFFGAIKDDENFCKGYDANEVFAATVVEHHSAEENVFPPEEAMALVNRVHQEEIQKQISQNNTSNSPKAIVYSDIHKKREMDANEDEPRAKVTKTSQPQAKAKAKGPI